MMQNSPIRTPGPMTASDETTAVAAIAADGSMGMNSYDKRRGAKQEGSFTAEAVEMPPRMGRPSGQRVLYGGDSDKFLAGIHLRSASKRNSNLTGLGRWSSMPAATHCSRQPASTSAVIATIGTC